VTTPTFERFFEQATGGHAPYRYQSALAAADPLPSVLNVPTGCGKTQALIVAWLYQRRVLGRGPRRLVYALPMRTLVEQTYAVATQVRAQLGLEDELRIHMLMGGATQSGDDWRLYPDQDQIIVGTIDMLLSRALNRGYGESRFAWPISFGFLNSDCRWVLDEVQLMGPARTTSAQLDGLRRKLGVALPCESIWVSATVDRSALVTIDRPELGEVLSLPDEDREGALAQRLHAPKVLRRIDLTSVRSDRLARAIAEAVRDHHRRGTRSIVVLNRVELAQQVTGALDRIAGDVDIVPLHSRYRPADRQRQIDAALAEVDPAGPGRIVVSTQVIEAGVDTTSSLLATETAPFSSIVQRLGRCNRNGDPDPATVLWLDRGEMDARQAAPYDPVDIAAARAALSSLVDSSVSPAALAAVEATEQKRTWSVLRRRHLLDLTDTSPDLSGLDVDVSRFIRADDERTVSVFFRADPGLEAARAERAELVDVPIGTLKGRQRWVYDYVDGTWRLNRSLYPGALVMLDAADGGYDRRLGWLPSAREPVEPVGPTLDLATDGMTQDPDSETGRWVGLREHLADVHRCARELLAAIGPLDAPPESDEAVVAAAALHDVGKAHDEFRERLLSTIDDAAELEQRRRSLWAKSARRGTRRRTPFRHELASVLAVLDGSADAALPRRARDLTLFLIAAHHGKIRFVVRSAPSELSSDRVGAATVLGIADGDALPAVDTPLGTLPPVRLSLRALDAEPSWTERACALRDDPALGPFRLAYLEALVRIADWRASA